MSMPPEIMILILYFFSKDIQNKSVEHYNIFSEVQNKCQFSVYRQEFGGWDFQQSWERTGGLRSLPQNSLKNESFWKMGLATSWGILCSTNDWIGDSCQKVWHDYLPLKLNLLVTLDSNGAGDFSVKCSFCEPVNGKSWKSEWWLASFSWYRVTSASSSYTALFSRIFAFSRRPKLYA